MRGILLRICKITTVLLGSFRFLFSLLTSGFKPPGVQTQTDLQKNSNMVWPHVTLSQQPVFWVTQKRQILSRCHTMQFRLQLHPLSGLNIFATIFWHTNCTVATIVLNSLVRHTSTATRHTVQFWLLLSLLSWPQFFTAIFWCSVLIKKHRCDNHIKLPCSCNLRGLR